MIGTRKITLEDLEIFAAKLRPGDLAFQKAIGRFNSPKGLEYIDWFCMALIGESAKTDPECRKWQIGFLTGGPGRVAAWQKSGAWIPPEVQPPGVSPNPITFIPE